MTQLRLRSVWENVREKGLVSRDTGKNGDV